MVFWVRFVEKNIKIFRRLHCVLLFVVVGGKSVHVKKNTHILNNNPPGNGRSMAPSYAYVYGLL